MHECPKCGKPMEYQPAEPDVGILTGCWFCTVCEVDVPEWEYDCDD